MLPRFFLNLATEVVTIADPIIDKNALASAPIGNAS